ncbi:MAG: TRAP transporter permease [Calditrichaeota bacterium]|nr:MAG: TRAP transporter permease [Calditrichota bacterium]
MSVKEAKELVQATEFGARNYFGVAKKITTFLAVLMTLSHLYFALSGFAFGGIIAMKQRSIHLAFVILLCFLFYPFSKKSEKDKLPSLDLGLGILGFLASSYIAYFFEDLISRIGDPTTLDLVAGITLFILIIEASRRTVSPVLPSLTLVFVAYAFLGPYLPDVIAHRGYSFTRVIDHIYLTDQGIFGVPIAVSASFVFLFVVFGAFLDKTGAGKFFIDLAFSLVGKFRGGPAKAAVIASAAFGSVSGSSIANAVTTGTLTIPLMKKAGFKPKIAAAVEVAASTNGQLMPPVMGAAAFIMAEFTDIPYTQIIKHALIPAVLSYFAIFVIIHLEALKTGVKGIPKEELPIFFKVLFKGFYHIIPLVILLYLLLVQNFTPLSSVFWSIVFSILVTIVKGAILLVKDKNYEINPIKVSFTEIYESMEAGARNIVGIASACACAGIIIGVFSLTGLGLKLTDLILTISGGQLLPTLILTMFSCIILGMGLPTTATYIIMVTLTVPALLGIDAALPLIACHLFVFYYGIVADDTPPVGLAAYGAAGIAGSDPIETGFHSFRFDLSAFVLPFVFIYNPELLMIADSNWKILFVFVTALIGMISWSAGIQGFLVRKTTIWERVLFFVFALTLIFPDWQTDLIGGVGFASLYFWQKKTKDK